MAQVAGLTQPVQAVILYLPAAATTGHCFAE